MSNSSSDHAPQYSSTARVTRRVKISYCIGTSCLLRRLRWVQLLLLRKYSQSSCFFRHPGELKSLIWMIGFVVMEQIPSPYHPSDHTKSDSVSWFIRDLGSLVKSSIILLLLLLWPGASVETVFKARFGRIESTSSDGSSKTGLLYLISSPAFS